MITKAVRFQIIKSLGTDWKEFGSILQDLTYKTTKMCNAAVQLYWENHNYRLQHKNETGKYPDAKMEKEKYSCSFRNYVYRYLREIYPEIASTNTSQTNQFAMNRWKNDVPDIMRLKKSIPSFRMGTPIQISNSNYNLHIAEGEKPDFMVDVALFGREREYEHGRFTLLLNGGDNSKKTVFRRIVDGTYKQGAMQIVKNERKKKWFCIMAFSFEPKVDETLDKNKAMGVNFASGENAIYWSVNFSPKRGSIPASEIIAAEHKIAAITQRRKNILRTASTTGHGRDRRIKAIGHLTGKSMHIRDAICHKYSRKIVDMAEANRCGTIRLADISKIELIGAFKTFSWSNLIEKIKYKAEEKGITVETSNKDHKITCSKCGYSSPENVEGNAEYFICKNPDCGAKISMDYNTVLNIARGC